MCDLSVLIGGEVVFRNAISAKVDGDKVILKNVLGVSEVFENCRIVEVDIGSERLVLSKD